MRTAHLRELGYGEHLIRTLLQDGRLERPARGWIALPKCDPYLVLAARNASCLTCVTQAGRLGLWTVQSTVSHLAPLTQGSRIQHIHRAHWGAPVYQRAKWALEDPIENVLSFVASCRPYEEAFAIWEAAFRKRLIDPRKLERLPYSGTALRLLEECTPYSDSGTESYFKLRTRRLGVRVLAQIYIEGHHVDFLLGDRLVVQIDGGTHTGRQRDEDNAHDAALMMLGYHVIRISYWQLMHQWADVFEMLLAAISTGKHLIR